MDAEQIPRLCARAAVRRKVEQADEAPGEQPLDYERKPIDDSAFLAAACFIALGIVIGLALWRIGKFLIGVIG